MQKHLQRARQRLLCRFRCYCKRYDTANPVAGSNPDSNDSGTYDRGVTNGKEDAEALEKAEPLEKCQNIEKTVTASPGFKENTL